MLIKKKTKIHFNNKFRMVIFWEKKIEMENIN